MNRVDKFLNILEILLQNNELQDKIEVKKKTQKVNNKDKRQEKSRIQVIKEKLDHGT